jgi:hypothetical protein
MWTTGKWAHQLCYRIVLYWRGPNGEHIRKGRMFPFWSLELGYIEIPKKWGILHFVTSGRHSHGTCGRRRAGAALSLNAYTSLEHVDDGQVGPPIMLQNRFVLKGRKWRAYSERPYASILISSRIYRNTKKMRHTPTLDFLSPIPLRATKAKPRCGCRNNLVA